MKEIWKKIDGFKNYSISNTGIVWNEKTKRCVTVSKTKGNSGYYFTVCIKNSNGWSNKRLHRLLAEVFIGDVEGMVVDHIDRDTFNNQLSNLRIVTIRENNLNCRPHKGKRVKYKGVYMSGKRYMGSVWRNKKQFYKLFATAEEAALWYDEMAVKIHGNIVSTNKSLGLLV